MGLFRATTFILLFPSMIGAIHSMLRERPLDISKKNGTIAGMQFAHIHHMKTGGTSLNQYIGCCVDRLGSGEDEVAYHSVTECSTGMIERCLAHMKEDADACNIKSTVVMNFCTSLSNVQKFGWGKSNKVTILRDPIDRVWSMYRFRTQSCYNCMPLAEIFQRVENGTLEEACGSSCGGVCMDQLFNHMTTNLIGASLASKITHKDGKWITDVSDQEILREAVHNLRTKIAVVGMTNDMNTTVKLLGEVFPWLAHSVDYSDEKCTIGHANRSPPNRCGEENLPPHPDPESKKLIQKYNHLDLELYKVGVQRFMRQKKWLEIKYKSSS